MEIQKLLFAIPKSFHSKSKKTMTLFFLHVLHNFISGDGIYDKLSNEEVISIVWDTLSRDEGKFKNIHEFCGKAV